MRLDLELLGGVEEGPEEAGDVLFFRFNNNVALLLKRSLYRHFWWMLTDSQSSSAPRGYYSLTHLVLVLLPVHAAKPLPIGLSRSILDRVHASIGQIFALDIGLWNALSLISDFEHHEVEEILKVKLANSVQAFAIGGLRVILWRIVDVGDDVTIDGIFIRI